MNLKSAGLGRVTLITEYPSKGLASHLTPQTLSAPPARTRRMFPLALLTLSAPLAAPPVPVLFLSEAG